ncbi:unnamed protein product [Nippostrongylus brasiliensis]|uniref:Transthyretin-like family protein n=1 Tax=Nippostrongylus brasiliensis TaxID=27835 RepID=A0A0N4Y4R2_NIPBR|nr:hypothetical protein Q1695_001144 [Nippostrongylus brasiliensis]VDL74501.1 unnamed protein product [Nippostrongylus brasiliensis]
MIALLILGFVFVAQAKEVRFVVQGRFYCDSNDDKRVFIELYERDPLQDDLLGWTVARVGDVFRVEGVEDEFFHIQPYLVVRHKCKDEPKRLVFNFGKVKKNMQIDIGDLDLEDPMLQADVLNKFEQK